MCLIFYCFTSLRFTGTLKYKCVLVAVIHFASALRRLNFYNCLQLKTDALKLIEIV